MKHLFSLLCLISSFSIFSQNSFSPGYIITNDGVKENILIRDMDWAGNPEEFQYRSNEKAAIQKGNLATVEEFRIGELKFERHRVNVDKSGIKTSELSTSRDPEFEEELLFLRVLVEGKASLYSLRSKGVENFFYKIDEETPKQLVNKRYNAGDGKVRHNTGFKQQLWNNLQCSEINLPQIDRTKYRLEPLKDLFVDFNECTDTDYIVYKEKSRKGKFNFGLKTGLNFTTFHLSQEDNYVIGTERNLFFEGRTLLDDTSLDPQFRLGLEIEYILPFKHGKWAVFLEPSYIPYKGEKEVFIPGGLGIDPNPVRTGVIADFVTFKYSALEIPLAVRYYIYLNQHSRIFINGGAGFNFHLNSSVIEDFGEGRTRERPDMKVESGQSLSVLLGLGYTHSSGISLETRYYPVKEVSNAETFRLHHNNSFSLIAGYKFF